MRGQPIDVTGMRFGILTALELSHIEKQGAYWVFKCDCGERTHLRLKDVRYGNTASCGCQKNVNKSNGWKKHKPTIDINRPWRKADQVDDRWLVLVGERCPRSAP